MLWAEEALLALACLEFREAYSIGVAEEVSISGIQIAKALCKD